MTAVRSSRRAGGRTARRDARKEGAGAGPTSALLGDVVISLPTATRQAAEHDRPIIAQVTFLLAHGLLHLLGYDHATRREERDMKQRTAELLAAVEAAR